MWAAPTPCAFHVPASIHRSRARIASCLLAAGPLLRWTALALLLVTRPVHATPGATLDQTRPGVVSTDGFSVARPQALQHLQLETRLVLDYSRNPLLFEEKRGSSGGALTALVSDQLAAHLGASLGLFDDYLVFVAMPVNLVLAGEALGTQPAATGFGAGDLGFGARGVFLHAGDAGALALQLSATLPTGATGKTGPAVAGDAGATLTPVLIGEFAFSIVRVTANAGLRVRKDIVTPTQHFGNELTYGLGLLLPIVKKQLDVHAELFGATAASDLGRRASTPTEALAGLQLHLDQWTFGLASGVGVTRGYGAPALRVLATVGFRLPAHQPRSAATQREQAAAPPAAEVPAPPTPVVVAPPEPAPARHAGADAAPKTAAVVPAALATPAPPAAAQQPTRAPAVAATVTTEAVLAALAAHPDQDADGDGIPNETDRCPLVPGAETESGCSRHLRVDLRAGEIRLLRKLRFEGGGLRVTQSVVLDEVAALLRAEVSWKVRIEARAASAAVDAETLAEMQQRADALRAWLTRRGIGANRLQSCGCGALSANTSGGSLAATARDERIDLILLDPAPKSGTRSVEGCTCSGP